MESDVITETVEITGMTCDACARRVEQALLRVPGVQAADVSYPRSTALVTGSVIETAALFSAVTAAGYGVKLNGVAAAQAKEAGSRRASQT